LRRPTEPAQYLSIRYTQRLAQAGLVGSVGTTGDSYDNAAAEAVFNLLKTEFVRRQGPWRNLAHVELALSEWVDWSHPPAAQLVFLHPAGRVRAAALS